jgi:hypothetical protein
MKQQLQNINGGISYEEYIFLQLGKEDRGKVMNLAFLMYGAPKILPYALMFNKNMLPSTFSSTGSSIIPNNNTPTHIYEMTLRQYERRQALINTLYNMEKQFITLLIGEAAGSNNSNSNNFVTNLFTRSSTTKPNGPNSKIQQKQILQTVLSEMSDLFRRARHDGIQWINHQTSSPSSKSTTTTTTSSSSTSPPTSISMILQKCEPYLYRTDTEFTGLEIRLGHVPSCIVQGMAQAILYHGIPNSITQFTPKVFHRRKFIGHIDKITKADEFLVKNQIDLATIPDHLLIEACQDRMIHIDSTSNSNSNRPNNHPDGNEYQRILELRHALSDWLQLTKSKYVSSSTSSIGGVSGSTGTQIRSNPMLETAKVVIPMHRKTSKVMTASASSVSSSLSSSSSSTSSASSLLSSTTTPSIQTTAFVSTSSDVAVAATTTSLPAVATPSKIYYNGNLARMIVMAYYGLASICTSSSGNLLGAESSSSSTIGHLPQLLYSSSSSSTN